MGMLQFYISGKPALNYHAKSGYITGLIFASQQYKLEEWWSL